MLLGSMTLQVNVQKNGSSLRINLLLQAVRAQKAQNVQPLKRQTQAVAVANVYPV